MSAYMLLCNYTDQGVRNIKEVPNRRAAARELGQKLGVETKASYLAIGPYDLVIHVEAPTDEALATFLLSLASKGNVRTTTLKLFPEAEYDKIVGDRTVATKLRTAPVGERISVSPSATGRVPITGFPRAERTVLKCIEPGRGVM